MSTVAAPAPPRAPGRVARSAGLVLGGFGLAAAVASVVLDLATPDAQRAAVAVGAAAPGALVAAGIAACGLWMLAAAPGNPMVWLLLGTGAVYGLSDLGGAWAAFGFRPTGVLPGVDWALWVVDQPTSVLVLALPLLLIGYPHGRLPDGRLGRVAAVALGLAALLPVLAILAPADVLSVRPPTGLDLDKSGVGWLGPAAPVLRAVASAFVVAAIAVGLVVVVRGRRAANGAERRRYDWLLWAAVVDLAVTAFVFTVRNTAAGEVGAVVAFLVTAVAVTVGILAPGLVDIDRLLPATVVYGLLTGLVLALDVAAVALARAVLGDRLAERDVTLAVLVVVALGYAPAREALRRLVRRLLVGRRDDPYAVLSALAARLERSDSPEDQLAAVTATVAEAFRVRFVGVEIVEPSGRRIEAVHGTRPARTVALPIAVRGEEVGQLVLPRSGARARLTARDEALLGDVVRQAAVAVRSSRLADALQDSRERLVTAREEERRRIRRDLHDGLGPTLGSVALRIDTARNLRHDDPERADALLASARKDVAEAVADLRRLVHGLRPPALDDVGLVAAVRQVAGRSGLPVDVAAGQLPALPAAVEVAALRIVSEAVTNVVRHAAATRAQVSLDVGDGALQVTVVDDGSGIATGAPAGVGLASLRERAAELGGRSEVTCPEAGGTVVRAWLPVGRGTE